MQSLGFSPRSTDFLTFSWIKEAVILGRRFLKCLKGIVLFVSVVALLLRDNSSLIVGELNALSNTETINRYH